MGDVSNQDLISELPLSIVDNILTRLPLGDAIRTSVLSSKWRYKWSTLTHLVFNEKCVVQSTDQSVIENKLVKFITRALFLHQGPIHKFQLSSSVLQSCPEIDQWLLFLSRNDIKELVLELGEGEWFRAPSCLFNCTRLTRLELNHCEFDPPFNFGGFLGLKSLSLHQVLVSTEVVESFISSCPLLESLSLSYPDSLVLSIRAPKLKNLYLDGEFKDIFLENTPGLVSISVSMYMTEDDIAERMEQSSSCNFVKVLGGVPHLQKLVGHVYFTKYLSIGHDSGSLSITYNHLTTIELSEVSFEDMSEVLVVLRLITHSPNLKELRITGSPDHFHAGEELYLDCCEKDFPSDCKLEKLKVVKMAEFSGILYEMEFIKFLLANSLGLEVMSIAPSASDADARLDMLIELLKLPRASRQAQICFIRD